VIRPRNILPILFQPAMAAAILREITAPRTGKVQTRRILKAQDAVQLMCRTCGASEREIKADQCRCGGNGNMQWTPCAVPRYRVNDVLYVREPWRVGAKHDATPPRDLPVDRGITTLFTAGGSRARGPLSGGEPGPYVCDASWPVPGHMPMWAGKERRGMHLPRALSRITLAVTRVIVEPLNAIPEQDAIDEGAVPVKIGALPGVPDPIGYHHGQQLAPGMEAFVTARASYRHLWNGINGAGSWEANPWVAAYTFRPIHANVDDILDEPTRYGFFA